MAIVSKRVCYSGHVQGVGFRYTADHLAKAYSVVGYVRNLPTGDVELVAEGPEEAVTRFLDALARRMADHIRSTTITDTAVGEYRSFSIRH